MKTTISYSILLALLLLSSNLSSQDITASQLLKESINYHDPKGVLVSKEITFDLIETRPNGKDRSTSIIVDVDKEKFTMLQTRDSFKINSAYEKGKITFLVNGKDEIAEEVKETYRLDEKRFRMMRNYYQYLWLLPIKLTDSGTILSDDIMRKDFFGKDALELKVTYTPEVGDDIWYFYFDPQTYALIGYRFYHDESKNDGEYIILEGETKSGDLRLPKERKWYMHKDDKFLGADICDGLFINK